MSKWKNLTAILSYDKWFLAKCFKVKINDTATAASQLKYVSLLGLCKLL